MYLAFQFDVFLSHSSHDKATVQALAERLRQDGLRVWFDAWAIQFGDSIPAKIENGLENSRILLLCMSASAFDSDWASLESQTFRFRDPQNKERRFLSVRLDNTEPRGTLAQFKYIDWRDRSEQAYQHLLAACRAEAAAAAALPDYLRGRPELAAFVQHWPHRRDALQLDFIDRSGQAIHAARVDDDYILRANLSSSGYLLLFVQGSSQTFYQLLPNAVCAQQRLAPGKHCLPGDLLPYEQLGPEVEGIVFTAPGVELALGFLLKAAPYYVHPHAPLTRLDDAVMREILCALLNDNSTALAFATLKVNP